MSDCTILGPGHLEGLLAGTLDDSARAVVADHLREATCEVCLVQLEQLDADRILAALAGPSAQLSAAEADAMFAGAADAAAPPGTAGPAPPRGVVPLRRRALAWVALAAAASVALLIGITRRPTDEATGVKAGGAGVELSLEGVVGRRVDGGGPVIDRRFARRGRLVPGESILFRYRLSRPAYLTLVIDRGEGGAVEWTAPPGVLTAEVAHGGRALSLDAERVPEGGAFVWLIASATPIETATTAPGTRPDCDGCTVAALEIVR